MSLFKIILDFIASLFKKDVKEEPVEEPQKMLMHEDVFNLMMSGESDETKDQVRKVMAYHDSIGDKEYKVATPKAEYLVKRPIKNGIDFTDQYGTQFQQIAVFRK